jgi:hypothetical protein
MKKKLLSLGFVALCFVMMAATAGATACSADGGMDVALGGLLANSITCTAGGFTFSNFQYSVASGSGTPIITLTNDPGQGTLVGGFWILIFNPNLGGTITDLHLAFTVTGPIDGAALTENGINSQVQEKNCNGTMDLTGTCVGTLVWNTSDTESEGSTCVGTTAGSTNGGTTTTCAYPVPPGSLAGVAVWKDLAVTGSNGHISSMVEGFQGVPEPMTFSLMGAGLLGLGLLRRKLKK